MAVFSMMKIALLILLWSVTNTNGRHLPDDDTIDEDVDKYLVNLLMKQPYKNQREQSYGTMTQVFFNQDRLLFSGFEDTIERGVTSLEREDYLMRVLISRIEIFIFEGDNHELRAAWEETLRGQTGNCYLDKECRTHLAKLTIRQVCRALKHIAALPPPETPIKELLPTIIRISKCLIQCFIHPLGILADLAQAGLEYIEYGIIGKVVGAVGNMFLAALTSKSDPDEAAWLAFSLWGSSEALRWIVENYLTC